MEKEIKYWDIDIVGKWGIIENVKDKMVIFIFQTIGRRTEQIFKELAKSKRKIPIPNTFFLIILHDCFSARFRDFFISHFYSTIQCKTILEKKHLKQLMY